jgi:hypothetical protein
MSPKAPGAHGNGIQANKDLASLASINNPSARDYSCRLTARDG